MKKQFSTKILRRLLADNGSLTYDKVCNKFPEDGEKNWSISLSKKQIGLEARGKRYASLKVHSLRFERCEPAASCEAHFAGGCAHEEGVGWSSVWEVKHSGGEPAGCGHQKPNKQIKKKGKKKETSSE